MMLTLCIVMVVYIVVAFTLCILIGLQIVYVDGITLCILKDLDGVSGWGCTVSWTPGHGLPI